MSLYDEDATCPYCEATIEDLSNKIYRLELYIEELSEANEEEVNYLHSEIDRLEAELRGNSLEDQYKGVF